MISDEDVSQLGKYAEGLPADRRHDVYDDFIANLCLMVLDMMMHVTTVNKSLAFYRQNAREEVYDLRTLKSALSRFTNDRDGARPAVAALGVCCWASVAGLSWAEPKGQLGWPRPVLACGLAAGSAPPKETIVTALGDNVHIFARPHRRQELAWTFETVLDCGRVQTIDHPGMAEPMLLVRFPGGGHLSIEFTADAPDDDHPRLGAWLELRAENPPALMRAVLDAGLTEVKHPGHPYYFMAPGGQVFTIAPMR